MRSLRTLRSYNYFYFSLLSIFISFLPVYLTSRGISMAETGMMIGAGAFIGVSGIVGSFFGGWIFEQFGGSTLYHVMAVLSGCGFLFSFIMKKATPAE